MDGKRLWESTGFHIACLIGCAAILLSVTWPQEWESIEALPCGSWLTFWSQAMEGKLVICVLPACAVLPYSDAYLQEKKNGFLRSYICRRGRMEYVKSKMFVMGAAGFLSWVCAALLAGFLLFFCLFPGEMCMDTELFFSESGDILLGTGLSILRTGLVGSIFGNLGAVCAQLAGSVYMAYGLPFVCYYMLLILKERYFETMYFIYPAEWISPAGDWGGSWYPGLWLFLILLDLAFILLNGAMLWERVREL
ncbi:MAG: hypothetical protein SOW08_08445 [Lachnospiraceae bacterium]|nr:hypothetical protein [Lachnospiraceae bacterium]